jgi:hypothetical protein
MAAPHASGIAFPPPSLQIADKLVMFAGAGHTSVLYTNQVRAWPCYIRGSPTSTHATATYWHKRRPGNARGQPDAMTDVTMCVQHSSGASGCRFEEDSSIGSPASPHRPPALNTRLRLILTELLLTEYHQPPTHPVPRSSTALTWSTMAAA